jgi:hypothetical protein
LIKKHARKIIFTIVIPALLVLFYNPSIGDAKINIKDKDEYIFLKDPFNRSLAGKLLYKASAASIDLYHELTGTFYEDFLLERLRVKEKTITLDEIKQNPQRLKEILKDRDERLGLSGIEVMVGEGKVHTLKDYFVVKSKIYRSRIITRDTVWTADKGPYYVLGEIKVLEGATLTIEEGTQVYFKNTTEKAYDSGILVDGKIIVNGTEENNVVFKPLDIGSSPGSWKGIYISQYGQAQINNAYIEKAGNWSGAGVYSLGDLKVANSTIKYTAGNAITSFGNTDIRNCDLSSNRDYGFDIYANHKDLNVSVTNNKLNDNNILGRIVYREACSPSYMVSGNTGTGNNINGLRLYGNISGSMSFTNPGVQVPYVLANRFNYDGTPDYFTINKEANVTFEKTALKLETGTKSDYRTRIIVDGYLNLNGTSSERAYVTSIKDDLVYGDTNNDSNSTIPQMDDYERIYVSAGGTMNMNYADLKFGGYSASNEAIVYSEGSVIASNTLFSQSYNGIYSKGDINIQNSNFDSIKSFGLYINPGVRSVKLNVKNNTFKNFKGYVSRIQLAEGGISEFIAEGNTAIDSGKNGVELMGVVKNDTSLGSFGSELPLVLVNRAFIDSPKDDLIVKENATLTLNPGTVLKMDSKIYGDKTNIIVNGKMQTKGNGSSKVHITSIKDDSVGGDTKKDGAINPAAGDWGTIKINGNKAMTSSFENTVISYGGDFTSQYVIYSDSSLDIANSTIRNNIGDALRANGNVALRSTLIENNSLKGLNVLTSNGVELIAENNIFKNNGDAAATISLTTSPDKLQVVNNSSVGNKLNGLQLQGNIDEDIDLFNSGSTFPYVLKGQIYIYKDKFLNIKEGAILKLDQQAYIEGDGSININGTSSNRVYITSLLDDKVGGDTNNDANNTSPGIKDYYGIKLWSNSNLNVNYANLSYGGTYNENALVVNYGKTNIQNSKFDNVNSAIWVYDNLVFSNNDINNVSSDGFYVEANKNIDLTVSHNNFSNIKNVIGKIYINSGGINNFISGNNTSSNNGWSGVELRATIASDTNLVPIGSNIPYILQGNYYSNVITVNSGAKLDVAPGTVIKMIGSSYISSNGNLNINGAPDNKVVLTSIKDDNYAGDTNGDGSETQPGKGDWGTLNLTGDSVIKNSVITYGGMYSNMIHSSGNLIMENSEVKNSNAVGIRAGNIMSLQSSKVTNNTGDGIEIFESDSADNSMTIKSNVISDNGNKGISILSADSTSLVLNSNTISKNGDYAAYATYSTKIPSLSIAGNTAQGNRRNGIGLYATVNHDSVLPYSGVNFPYILESGYYTYNMITVNSGAKLDIAAGTIMKIGGNSYIASNGNLNINGVPDNKVVLTSIKDDTYAGDTNGDGGETQPGKGDWGTLNLTGDSVIKNSVITYGGMYSNMINSSGNLTMENSEVKNSNTVGIRAGNIMSLQSSKVTDNTGDGIEIFESDSTDNSMTIKSSVISDNGNKGISILSADSTSLVLNGNTISKNGDYAAYATYSTKIPSLSIAGNTAQGNRRNGIGLYATVNHDSVLPYSGVNFPYILESGYYTYNMITVNSGAKLDIAAGTIMKIGGNSYIASNGNLNINGVPDNKVVLTSIKDDTYAGDTNGDGGETQPGKGDWGTLNLTGDSVIKNSVITYGGMYSNMINSSGNLTMENSEVKNSNTVGIRAGNIMSLQSSKVTDNTGDGIEIFESDSTDNSMTIKSSVISDNGNKGISILSADSTSLVLNGNTISKNGDYAAYATYSTKIPSLSIAGNTAQGNRRNGIGLYATVNHDSVLPYSGVNFPYILESGYYTYNMITVNSGAKLDVEAGTVIKLGGNSYIASNGNLNINGAFDNKVILTSIKDDSFGGDTNGDGSQTQPAKGDWGSIQLTGDSVIKNSVINYGGMYSQMIYSSKGLTMEDSEVKNSNTTGITAYNKITLRDSNILNNSNKGIDISATDSINVVLESNNFKNNGDYAAFAHLIPQSGTFAIANNTAENNKINGFGLSATFNVDFQLPYGGQSFPYVIPENLEVSEGKTLRLLSGVAVKFNSGAKVNLNGKIVADGTESSKIRLTSIKDDTIGGDTNNDGDATKPDYEDWIGIVYNKGSEGSYDNFECEYSKFNMDYRNISYVKADSKGADSVSVYNNYGLYIRNTSEGQAVILHNYYNNSDKVLSSGYLSKTNSMISGNYAAWIEGDSTIKVYNLNTGVTSPINATGVRNFYINDGQIVWTTYSGLAYKPLSGGTAVEVEDVDIYFRPVISSDYLIYKHTDGNIRKRDLQGENIEYYMITNRPDQKDMVMHDNNIAFLRKSPSNQVYNVTVGNVPTWDAVDVTSNIGYDNSSVSLYKDKLMYFNNGYIPVIKVIKSDGVKKCTEISIFTNGYNVKGTGIGEQAAAFTDDSLVYLVNTKFTTVSDKFVSGSLTDKSGYTRKMDFGTTLSAKIGCEIGYDTGDPTAIVNKDEDGNKVGAEVTGGLALTGSRTGTYSLIIQNYPTNSPKTIGIGRELVDESGVEAEAKAAIGLGEIAEVSTSVSASASGMEIMGDEHHFDKQSPETYKKIGLLTVAGLIRQSQAKGIMQYVSISELIKKAFVWILEEDVNAESSSVSYEKGKGMGVKFAVGSDYSADLGIIEHGISAQLNSQGIASVGQMKENNVYSRYVSTESMFHANFTNKLSRSLDLYVLDEGGIDLSIEGDNGAGISLEKGFTAKLPDLVFNELSSKLIYSAKLKENPKELEITLSDDEKNTNGYVNTYIYTIKGADLQYAVNNGLIKNINEMQKNINSLNGFSLQRYGWNADSSIFDDISDLMKILQNADSVDYKIRLSKSNSKELSLAFDASEAPNLVVKATGGIGITGSYSDEISLDIDSGTIVKGKVQNENTQIAFVPVKNPKMREVLMNAFTGLASQIFPVEVSFTNNKATYFDKLELTNPGGNLRKARFVKVPFDISNSSKESEDIGNGMMILKDPIYFETYDNRGNQVRDYSTPIELKLHYSEPSLGVGYTENNYAIFEYLEGNGAIGTWVRHGGTIDKSSNSITIQISHSGQYAIGVDKSNPKINWKLSDNTTEIAYDTLLNPGDYIYANITDKDNVNSVIVKTTKNGTLVDSSYVMESNNIIRYNIIDSMQAVGEKQVYKIEVEYTDSFGNKFTSSKTIEVKGKEPPAQPVQQSDSQNNLKSVTKSNEEAIEPGLDSQLEDEQSTNAVNSEQDNTAVNTDSSLSN